jgi:carbon-monoxide dehydrogenase small subunit
VTFGLEGKTPSIRMSQAFVVNKPIDEVWSAFEDIPFVAACLPGARLDSDVVDDIVAGSLSAKLGPITASFSGKAKIERDRETHSGSTLGKGLDARAGSRVSGEVGYKLIPNGQETRVELEIRALMAGPLSPSLDAAESWMISPSGSSGLSRRIWNGNSAEALTIKCGHH